MPAPERRTILIDRHKLEKDVERAFVNNQFRVNFLIVGAQKSGTSALASFLSQHPEICHSPRKEVHFFDSRGFDDSASAAEIEARYHRSFPNFRGQKLVGESTPIYMFLPHVAARIHRYNPGVKLIVLLRDPVARAISHYHMAVGRRNEKRPMIAAFLLDRVNVFVKNTRWGAKMRNRSYLARGFYTRQIENLLRYFDRSQILILRNDDLADQHEGTLQKIYDFLGVEDRSIFAPAARVGKSDYTVPTPWLLKRAMRFFFAREIRRLEKFLDWNLTAWRLSF